MRKRLSLVLLLLFVAALVMAEDYSDTIDRTFSLNGTPDLILRNPDGVIHIEPGEGADVSIKITREVRGAKDQTHAKKELDRISLELEQVGNQVRAIARWRDGFRITSGPSIQIRYVVRAPKKSNVKAEVSDGELYVTGLTGTIELNASDGDISANDLNGNLRIHASDGTIELKNSSGSMNLAISDGDLRASGCKGQVTIRSGDGRVELPGFEGTAEVSNGDGDVLIDGVLTTLRGRTGDGEMKITVAPGSVMQSDWTLSSGDGQIYLDLPDDFSADLQITAGDARVETDHPVHVVGRLSSRNVSGKIGSGGHLLQIKTGDGHIAIK